MEHVRIERDAEVAIFRLHRPPANAFDLDFAGEIEAAFISLTADADLRAIVLTGTGSCFSAGLDLKRVPFYGPAEQRAMVTTVNSMISRLYACPLPVVGAINGHAIAGGLVVALACDYRIGTTATCQLGVTEARAGIPFPAAAMTVLRAELPPHVARVLTLRAQNVDPPTALAWGVVDELQPGPRVLPAAVEAARDLARVPRDAYRRIKHQLRAAAITAIEDTRARGSDPMLEDWLSAAAPAAAAALLRGGQRR